MVEEDCFNALERHKIEETVMEILNTSDLETATEFGIRAAASDRLGFDLAGFPHRRLVRQLIDSFLLSTAKAILTTTPSTVSDGENNINNSNSNVENAVHPAAEQQPQQLGVGRVEPQENYDGKIICKIMKLQVVNTYEYSFTISDLADKFKLSESRRVTVHELYGSTMVSIRDFYIKDGNMLPRTAANSGVSLPAQQWASFRNSVPTIEEAITKLESRLRSEEAVAKWKEADMTNSVAGSAAERSQVEADSSNLLSIVPPHIKNKQTDANPNSEGRLLAEGKNEEAGTSGSISVSEPPEQITADKKQATADISTSAPAFPAQEQVQHAINAITRPEGLVPRQTARLNGRNYHSWRHHMLCFLKQLNLTYVLTEPCPGISLNPESSFAEKARVGAANRRWVDDDYLCRHNILNSLSDSLFQQYSQKSGSARDLWEELKALYDEDFGTKRSQINKYIHFQMVDGVSVLEQVQKFHNIVNSIINSGTWIDENFHVSVIISKLPPSWKEFRVRLMREDVLPLNMLMHRIQVEENLRNSNKKESYYTKGRSSIEAKLDHRAGMIKKGNKRVCFSCGREGHTNKNCPTYQTKNKNGPGRKSYVWEKSNEKEISGLSQPTATNRTETANVNEISTQQALCPVSSDTSEGKNSKSGLDLGENTS